MSFDFPHRRQLSAAVIAAAILLIGPGARAQGYPAAGAPTPSPPVEYGAGEIYDVDEAPPGDAAPSVDAFVDELSRYGGWYQHPRFGRIWAPYETGFRPYHRGYWQPTKFGLVWIAEEPFGWVTSHYGRWFWNRRWFWVPDSVWAPAWVVWRETDDHLGWAPMPPDGAVVIPDAYWHFVPARYVLRVDLPRVYVGVNVSILLRDSRPFTRYVRTPRGERYLAGPDPAFLLRRWNVAASPMPMVPRTVGRYPADAWHDRRLRDQRRRDDAAEQRRRYEEQRRWQQDQQRRWQQEERQRQRQLEEQRRTRDHRDQRPAIPSRQPTPVIPPAPRAHGETRVHR